MEKWKIKITEKNKPILDNYLKENGHKYVGYHCGWKTSVPGYFFSENIDSFHSAPQANRLEGYTLVDNLEHLGIYSLPLIFN